jgi:hypothetical protein
MLATCCDPRSTTQTRSRSESAATARLSVTSKVPPLMAGGGWLVTTMGFGSTGSGGSALEQAATEAAAPPASSDETHSALDHV